MRSLQDGWLFYDANVLPIVRSMLEAWAEIRAGSLDIGDLAAAAYIDDQE
jgi:hypothetical protein